MQRDKKSAQEAAKRTREARARLEQIKTLPELIREADAAFAAYIRMRDMLAGHRCISSGRELDWNGNAVDAGHYRSRGEASHLRYDERNCHAQNKHDNRYLSGNITSYRIGLIERIGQDQVDDLEADNRTHKWTRDEVRAIRDHYRAALRRLKRDKSHT